MKYKIMVWWKKVLIVIGALLILFLILGIFMPRNVEVSQSRTINAPIQYVFNLLNNLKDSKQWNPFIIEDPDMELTYGQIWEGEGAQLTWKSSVVGNGSNIYTSSVKNQLIESDLLMEGMDTSFYAFQLKENEKKTTDLTWSMKSRLGFPYNALGFVFKYMIKKSYRKGLDNIEKVVAQRMNNKIYNGHKINESLITERNYALNRKVIKANEVRDFYSQSLGPIFQKIQSEGLTMTGKPVALYFSYDQVKQETDMAAGVPINIAREIKDLSFVNIAAQPAIQVDFTGDYSDLGPVHEAIKTYMMDRNLVKSGPAIEEYITDPIEEKDPKKYVTKIIYPFTTSK